MATAKTVAVSRVKLIERLQQQADAQDKTQAQRWKSTLSQQIKEAEVDVRKAQRHLETPDDTDEYWARDFRRENGLRRHITLLELSDAETINVGPTSDFFQWL